MGTLASTSEIVESIDEVDQQAGDRLAMRMRKKHSIEEDINRLLFQASEVRYSVRNQLGKSAMKRPMRACMSPSSSSGIGISEAVSLKQALRGLCISQASEMAAMKRLSKPLGSSGASGAGDIRRLYRAVVVESTGSELPINQGKANFVEISLVPEKTLHSLPPQVVDSVSKEAALTLTEVQPNSVKNSDNGQKCNSSMGSKINKSFINSPRFIRKSINSVRSKVKMDLNPSTSISENQTHHSCTLKREENVKSFPIPNNTQVVTEAIFSSNCSGRTKPLVRKGDERMKLREKWEFSQSSKSSIGEFSSCTSTSEESSLSGSSRSGKRPHMSKDVRWEAIHHILKQHGGLGMSHFKLQRRLGCGDIGSVYLAELSGTNYLFALKVMDSEFLASRKKMLRAQTEREILEMVDHPFLPTLFAHFESDKLSCLVMEHCPGGDLHVLRQKQPFRCFSEQAARFYVAEILVAIEYLHMLGVVYRDLKPENVLVREDGHIMLTDFDLSLKATSVNLKLVKSSSSSSEPAKKLSSPCMGSSSCIDPFCLNPPWQVSCFTPRLLSTGKMKSELATQVTPLPQLVVEPTNARSNSFVGTHEYLAPEIVKGESHGSAVDWWTFGIFLFELLYGRTPFKGSGDEDTLSNVASQSLKFPDSPMVSFHARDLIKGLLIKDPETRLGSGIGAAEIKQHSFFEGLNWALIRCEIPPELPKFSDITASQKVEMAKCKELDFASEHTEFEVF